MSDSQIPADSNARTEEYMRLFVANQRRIYGFVFSLVPVEADADDLVQETCTVLWSKFDEYTPGSDFGAWALQIARYEVLRYRKRHSDAQQRFSNAAVESLSTGLTEWDATRDQRRLALSECLDQLPSADRQLVQQRYEEGTTTKAVAEEHGKSVFTIYKSLNRIHQSLLRCIQRKLAVEARTDK